MRLSSRVLKGLTYRPTGAIVAAPTTSLPETVGGERNWDYRYTWIRDSSFTLYGLMRLGYTEEAAAFMRWVMARVQELKPDGSLQIMYGLDGRHELREETLPHLEGYMGSRPVRIGIAAHVHLQLDIYGELLDSVYLYDKYGSPISHDAWMGVIRLVDWVAAHWREKDESIWEVRGGRQEFLYSRVMCWVAIDRAIRRGTGEEEGVNYEEITYEGYGPGGVALLIEAVTDNRNRTVAEIRHIFSKNGGNLGESGSVGWMFEKKGYLVVEKAAKPEDELFDLAIEAGAEDIRDDEDNWEIITAPDSFEGVQNGLKSAGITPQVAEVESLRSAPLEKQVEGLLACPRCHARLAVRSTEVVCQKGCGFEGALAQRVPLLLPRTPILTTVSDAIPKPTPACTRPSSENVANRIRLGGRRTCRGPGR